MLNIYRDANETPLLYMFNTAILLIFLFYLEYALSVSHLNLSVAETCREESNKNRHIFKKGY